MKNKSGSFLNGGHEHFSITPFRRFGAEKRQAMREHFAHLVELDRTDTRHRTQFSEHRKNSLGLTNRHRAQALQGIKPFAPNPAFRESIEKLDQRHRKISKVPQTLALTFHAR